MTPAHEALCKRLEEWAGGGPWRSADLFREADAAIRSLSATKAAHFEDCARIVEEADDPRYPKFEVLSAQLRAAAPLPSGMVCVPREAVDSVGKWLAAALDDSNVCVEMKADIERWFAGVPR